MGQTMAIKFSKLGAHLALNDFNENGIKETLTRLDPSCKVFTKIFDVSQKEPMFEFADEVKAHFGRVDVVINNAGVALTRYRFEENSYKDWEWIMGINFWGVLYGCNAFMPYLREQKESSLVNFSSIFGLHGIPGQIPYSATKFAVRGLTESLSMEESIHKTGVAVLCVHPGGVKTAIAKSARGGEKDKEAIAKFEKTFITTSETAADVVIKGIRKKKERILIGIDAHGFIFAAHKMRFIIKYILKTAYNAI
jgi:NADP-dependent 3-hydroxy acid dehydrogenase YdfG